MQHILTGRYPVLWYNIFMKKITTDYSLLSNHSKIMIYYEIRDDISMILCRMGDICDLNDKQEEYDLLHTELSKNLVYLDRMYKDALL